MLNFLLSCLMTGTVFSPEYLGMIAHIGSHSMVQIADSSPSFIVLAQENKPSENDPIVPPN